MTWGDLITLEYGKPISDKNSTDGNVPVYGTNGKIGTSHLEPLCKIPSFIVGRKGAYRGIHYSDVPFSVIDTAFYAMPISNDFDIKWAYYKFLTYDINRMDSGSAIPSTDRYEIYSIPIKLPTVDIQKKIVSMLDSFSKKIELNAAINENLEKQVQAIFKSWFIDFKPFGGVMPDDWNIGNIADLAKEIICGKTPSTKKKEYYGDFMPFITIPDMHNCVYAISTERYLSELGMKSQENKTLHKNSICVSCIGTAGLVVLVSVESQTNQQINSIVPKDNYSPYYIYLLMQTMSEKINQLGQSGSTIVNLNKAQFGIMEALIPSITSMNDFNSIAQPLFEQILANQQENLHLATLRDTLLPKLMNGEIDVSEVKI